MRLKRAWFRFDNKKLSLSTSWFPKMLNEKELLITYFYWHGYYILKSSITCNSWCWIYLELKTRVTSSSPGYFRIVYFIVKNTNVSAMDARFVTYFRLITLIGLLSLSIAISGQNNGIWIKKVFINRVIFQKTHHDTVGSSPLFQSEPFSKTNNILTHTEILLFSHFESVVKGPFLWLRS